MTRITTNRPSFNPPPMKIPFEPTTAKAVWHNGTGGAAGGRTTPPRITLSLKAPADADLRTNVSVKGNVVTVTVGGNALPGAKSTSRQLDVAAPMLSGQYTLVVKNESGKVLSKKTFDAQIPA